MRARRVAGFLAAAAMLLQAAPGHAAMSIVRTVEVKKGPAAIAFDPLTQQAFVGSVTDDTVSVFAGPALVAEISQPGLNPAGIGVDPSGMRLLVSSHASNKVNVYSTIDRRKTASISVPGGPWGLAVDPSRGTAFVATFGANALTVIGRDNTMKQVTLAGCQGAIGAAYVRQTDRVVVTCIYSGTVHVLDALTQAPVGTITIGLGAYTWGVASSPSSPIAYITNWSGGSAAAGTVMLIDTATATLKATAFTGGAPIGVAVSTLGTPYVTLSATHKLAVLEASSGAIVESIPLPMDSSTPNEPNNPQAVAVHPSGRYAIVGNFHAESVSFVNTLAYL